jgi:peptide deformylase
MPVLPLLHLGHPTLRDEAQDIADPTDPAWAELARDMIETMEAEGGVGLAGPQVDRPHRLIVFKVPAERQGDDEPPGPEGVQVLANPEWSPIDDDDQPIDDDALMVGGLAGVLAAEDGDDTFGEDLDLGFDPMEMMEEGLEGCLSIPGLRGLVPRYKRIRYSGTDLEGRPVERIAEGFHARVVQHECDHLNGVLFIDQMIDLHTLCFESELHYLLEGKLDPDID